MAGRIPPMLLKKTPVAVLCNAAACGCSAWADLPEPVGRGPSAETQNFPPPQAVICRWPQGTETKYRGCLLRGPGAVGNTSASSIPVGGPDTQSAPPPPLPQGWGWFCFLPRDPSRAPPTSCHHSNRSQSSSSAGGSLPPTETNGLLFLSFSL